MRKKLKKTFLFLFLSLMLAFILPSCKEKPDIPRVTVYSTPTIKGTISIPDSSDVSPEEVYAKVIDSSDKTITIQNVNSDGSFVIKNLNADMTYRILFTSEEPEFNNRSVSRGKGSGVGGWINDVVPAVKEGYDVGSVRMKPLGTIKGKALVDGAADNYDITVYIPGTSYSAITDKDGNFSIYNVPEGTYTLRYIHEGCVAVMTENVILVCPEESENPEKNVGDITLFSSKGNVEGVAVFGDDSDSNGISIRLESEDNSLNYTAITSGSGKYVINGVEQGRYRVVASYADYLSQYSEYFSVVPATTTTVPYKLVLIGNYGTIRGTVTLKDSEVKGGISILIKSTDGTNSFSVLTDSEGSFTKIVRPGDYIVIASFNGYTSETQSVTVVEDKAVNPTFSLTSVYGTIRGKSSSKGETVTLINSTGTAVNTIVTSDDCSYTFTNITPGTYSVRFSKTNYANYDVTDVLVAADKTTTVNGQTLVNSFGKISGTSNSVGETVSLLNSSSSVVYTVTTGSDRKYEFSNIAVGTYTIRFTKDGYSAYETTSYTVRSGSSFTANGIALTSLYGTISGKSESAGETVYLIKGTQSVQSTTTLESKEYTFSNVEPGDYIVRFTKTDYTSYDSSKLTVEAGGAYVVDGEKLAAIYGSISGKTVTSGEFVSLVDSNGKTINTIQTSSDFSFSFTRLQPETYSLSLSKTGYLTTTVEGVIVTAGENTSITTPELVSTYGTVTGFVALEGASDNAGVTVTLTDSSDTSVVYNGTSAADGSFRITEIVKSGTYLLTYSKDGYVSNLSNSVDVTVGKVVTADSVTLKSVMSTVSGKIQLDGASTHENVTILLKNETNQYNATTDQKGEYKINRVLPGTYTLMASKDGYVTASTNDFVIESSSEKEVELLTLSVAIRSITGSVELELLDDYAGALVTATNLADSTDVYSAITNSAGDYTLAGMTPGEYSIVISYNGYRTATLATVNVVSSTVTTIPLTEMKINRGTITGVAKLEGRSSSEDITVELMRGSDVYALTYTDDSGSYSFYVPQGNYTGVRYTKTDFASSSVSKDIALFADNYFSMGNETLTATHNSVYGTVDVLTTDDESSVTISFDGVSTIESYETTTDGEFKFEHVPVGKYTLRFQRQDCSDITIPVEVKAADGINLGKVEITPNTATIKGKVNLDNGTSLSGVKVSVDIGTKVLETTTDDSGRYEIGGVSIADEYTVTYSKDGWDNKTQQITPKLSILEVRELDEVTLVDTTAPVLSSVVINSGANTTSKKNITLNLTASDEGSGLDKIMVTYDDVFDRTVRQYDYSSIFSWELPAENGLKTIYLRVVDRAGNESASYTASVTLTDQKTEVSGTMEGDNLTWTKDKSPYLVTGSVMVEEGTTLTIEPGVDVQFAGNYGITVEGTIKAIGTENEKISFYGVDEGENNWIGINCKNNNRSMLKYIDMQGSIKGLQGYISVLNSYLKSSNYVLASFVGELCDSTVYGGIFVEGGSLIDNSVYLVTPANVLIDFVAEGNWSGYKNVVIDSYLAGNIFEGGGVFIGGIGENNIYTDMTVALCSSNNNISFKNCTIYIMDQIELHNYIEVSWMYFHHGTSCFKCVFNNCEFKKFDPTVIKESNFIDCNTTIKIETKFSDYEEVDLTSNFWGYANTTELQTNGLKTKHSFITDYYADSEFSITKANLSNFRTEPNADAGYKGDSYYSYPTEATTVYSIGNTGPAGGIVFFDKGYYSNGWRYLEAAPSDVDTSNHIFGYYRATANSGARAIGSSTVIGAGRLNSEMLVKVMGDEAYNSYNDGGEFVSDYASEKCLEYEYGGYSDWFLPSKDELNLMYTNLHKDGLESFSSCYWSSSEYNSNSAWLQNFYIGFQSDYDRYNYCYVRPIRAF